MLIGLILKLIGIMMTILTSIECLQKYGAPEKELSMILWDVPTHLEIGVIPKRLYCNKDMIKPLTAAFEKLIKTGAVNELKTWDGCFNIRQRRSGSSPSLHSWGVAIDVNAAWNRMGQVPSLSKTCIDCFTSSGFDWGGYWSRPDGMHFQLTREMVVN